MVQDTQVVVFASQKGGSGKTTLSGHIAVQAELSGAGPVAVIDTDPQGSLSKWWNARSSETPLFAKTTTADLARDINALRRAGIKLIIVDTPPAVTSAISDVVSHADLVVVPTRPSPHDLRAVGVTVDLVEAQRKPLMFVVNCATARARITSETAVSLSQHGTVAPVTIHNRVDYAASMIDGRTVCEVAPSCRSAQEVATLWKYIEERLRRIRPVEDWSIDEMENSFDLELLTPLSRATQELDAVKAKPKPKPKPQPQRHVPAEPVMAEEEALGWIGEGPEEAPIPEPLLEKSSASQARSSALERLMQVAQNSNWDGIDRRRGDRGPPQGVEDRRRYPVFGRKNVK